MTQSYQEAITHILAGGDLGIGAATEVMADIMSGTVTEIQIAALLTALHTKGETADELCGFATAMREKAIWVKGPADCLDTCGTGGSGLSTANTSTMSAFILSAAGVKVAKHGNRASSGKCGSTDVLEALGVRIDPGPEDAARLLGDLGIAFLHAPRYHPAVRYVVPVRKQLGFRTVFNFLGPLCNPAGTRRQLIGVSDPAKAPLMAEALAELGSEKVMVVHGSDGLDEITLTGPTRTWTVVGGAVAESILDPTDLGLKLVPFEAIAGGDKEENTRIFLDVLSGEERGPRRDHLLLNAAAGLYVADLVQNLKTGLGVAADMIDSGRALTQFVTYRDASQRTTQ
jgi:anthranilate phosphoribosyltransferase